MSGILGPRKKQTNISTGNKQQNPKQRKLWRERLNLSISKTVLHKELHKDGFASS